MTEQLNSAAEATDDDTPKSGVEGRLQGDGEDAVLQMEVMNSPEPTVAPRALPPGKLADLLKAVERKRGATLAELTSLMGWQPHTVRAALSRLRKLGYCVSREQIGSRNVYRAVRV